MTAKGPLYLPLIYPSRSMGQQTAGEIPAVGYAAKALPEHIVQAMQKDRHMAACFVPYLIILDQRAAVGAGEVLAEAVGAQLLGNPPQTVLHLPDEV